VNVLVMTAHGSVTRVTPASHLKRNVYVTFPAPPVRWIVHQPSVVVEANKVERLRTQWSCWSGILL